MTGCSRSLGCPSANGRECAHPNPIEPLQRGVRTPDQDPDRAAPAEAAMLFWALLAAGQIIMRKVERGQTLTHKLADQPIDLAA